MNKLTDVFHAGNIRRGELDAECLFYRQDQADMCEAVPAVNVGGCSLGGRNDVFVVENIAEYFGQFFINLSFGH